MDPEADRASEEGRYAMGGGTEPVRAALRRLNMDPGHDYDDMGTHIEWLGLWADDLGLLAAVIPPGWQIVERWRVRHDQGDWVRVDIVPNG